VLALHHSQTVMAAQPRSSRTSRSKGGASEAESSGDEFIDPSFDDVIVVDRSADRHVDRGGEPLRVCLECGEEDPSTDGVGPCPHREIAAFAEAPDSAVDAAERVRRAMLELAKAQRALSAVARSAVTASAAVIDERAPAPVIAPVEAQPCVVCAERAAFEARDNERSKVKRKKLLRAGDVQAAFAFAVDAPAPEEPAAPEALVSSEVPVAPELDVPSSEANEPLPVIAAPISEPDALVSPAPAQNEDAPRTRGRRKRAAA
jgi:hypothetical protein